MTSLSPAVRRLVLSDAVSAFGNGLVLPVTLIYLHTVRHIPLPTTGLLLAIPGAVGLVAVPVAGVLMDRVGARQILAVSLVLFAVAQLALGFVSSAAWAAPVMFVQGIGMSPTFPAFNTVLAGLTTGEAQQRAFAVNFTVLNGSIGAGGVVSGLIVSTSHALTFQVLFWGNAIVTVAAAAIVLTVPSARPSPASADAAKPSYRAVVADPLVRRVVVLSLVLAFTGYAALDSTLPAYANVVGGVSARIIALSLSANTLLIVVVQLLVLRLLRGRRRSRAIVVVGAIWCVSWALFGLCALPSDPSIRDLVVLAFGALFGLGETFMAPSISPLLNSLAPENVRGRANALTSGMYSIAFVISPAISAAFIAGGLGGVWIGLLSGGCLLVTVMALRLGGRLTRAQDVAQAEAVDLEPEPMAVA
jgi:MFS family permease